ncbi:Late embryogenesis abundant protein [Vigna unguiculata]|uniref:Late embryogenesis abundant protein n=1 Tax=Vigna unguiculata TaxID=3917 RepID=A0A4D6L8A1_VIGUN|nr:Late embryogenesis abundant protein [Vigna unguiculata]
MTTEGHANAVEALPPPPGRYVQETYIVQFPKDQVYRVPPRENALFLEQFRKPVTVKKTRRFGCRCGRVLLTVVLVVVSVVAVVGITLATLYFIFSPTGPTFGVGNLAVKSGGAYRNSRTQYRVSLRVHNPNDKLGIHYAAGDVWLFYERTKVAAGRFPSLDQGREELSTVIVMMSGPSAVVRRVSNSREQPVALKLEMKLGMRIRIAGIETWLMRSNVYCDFEVTDFGNKTRVSSQDCYTEFKEY